jgi:hypothetical protein
VGALVLDAVFFTGGGRLAAAVEPGAVGALACGFTGAGMGFFEGGLEAPVVDCGLIDGGTGFFAVAVWGFTDAGTGFFVGREVVVAVLVDILMFNPILELSPMKVAQSGGLVYSCKTSK